MASETMKKTSSADIKESIIALIRDANRPVSTNEIVKKSGFAWSSIQLNCLQLQLENRIVGYRVGNMNVWEEKRHDR